MARQPCSWWAAAGEIQTSKPHDKVTYGGEQNRGPYDEKSCARVETSWKRERSLRSLGEGHARCEDPGGAEPTNPLACTHGGARTLGAP